MHEVTSLPCHFKNSFHFPDSPGMFSHWDQLAIQSKESSSPPLNVSIVIPSFEVGRGNYFHLPGK